MMYRCYRSFIIILTIVAVFNICLYMKGNAPHLRKSTVLKKSKQFQMKQLSNSVVRDVQAQTKAYNRMITNFNEKLQGEHIGSNVTVSHVHQYPINSPATEEMKGDKEGSVIKLNSKNTSLFVHVPSYFVAESTDKFYNEGFPSDYLNMRCRAASRSGDNSSIIPNKIYGFVGEFPYMNNYRNPCWMQDDVSMTPKVHCVPYFYIIGAPKSGTADLAYRISMHPENFLSYITTSSWFNKVRFETSPHFSTELSRFSRASEIISMLPHAGTDFHKYIIGVLSPTYFYDNRYWRWMPGNEHCQEPRVTVASHVHYLYPESRILLVLRNPVDRLYSDYMAGYGNKHDFSVRVFHSDIVTAIKSYRECLRDNSVRQCANGDMLHDKNTRMLVTGLYSVFISDWLQLFGHGRVFVMTTERYKVNMEEQLRKLFRFLDLRDINEYEMRLILSLNVLKKEPIKVGPMMYGTRKVLNEFYSTHNINLSSMMNNTDFKWL